MNKKGFLNWIGGDKARVGPKCASEAGETAYIRYLRDETYKPSNLKVLNRQPTMRPRSIPPPTFPKLREHAWPK